MNTNVILRFLVILSASFEYVSCSTEGSAVNALVYTDIDVNSYDKCARLLNGTSQIGCQSSLSGNVGVIFHVNQSDDVRRLLTAKHNPYVVVIEADNFNQSVVRLFKSSGKVNGVVVYSKNNYTSKLAGWSPDLQCPRYHYGLYNETYGGKYAKCDSNPWNSFGDGLTEEDINFPIFFMTNESSTKSLIDCHYKHNVGNEYPLCSAQMKARMDGAQSTETCIRRNNLQNNLSPAQYCDEIGGRTVLATLQVTNSSAKEDVKPVILVMAAYDSRSFDVTSSSPGANSATGFISLLAIAQALGNLTRSEKDDMNHNVMFVLFDGEAFDNMGSLRMVYDMSKDAFPFGEVSNKWQPARFNLSQVSHVIEIGQIGLASKAAYIHYDPVSYQNDNIKQGINSIINALNESSNYFRFLAQSPGIGLVPSSLQSILRERNVPGVVVTDFDKQYNNKYYFSRYDTPDKLGIDVPSNTMENDTLVILQPLAEKIKNISTVISKAVYRLATGNTLEKPEIDEMMMRRILYCYYFNDSCSLARAVINKKYKNLRSAPIPRYVGVYSKSIKYGPYLAKIMLFYFLGEEVKVNNTEQCSSTYEQDDIYGHYFINHSHALCIRAAVYDMDGRSPSAVISDYDYANGRYGAWSESNWQSSAYNLRIFLVQESSQEGMVLLSGLIVFLFSFVIVFIINRKSDILFAGETL